MTTRPNGQAFPTEHYIGLTKLEYFSAMAMQGFCANEEVFKAICQESLDRKKVAIAAVKQAEVLIEELNKEKA